MYLQLTRGECAIINVITGRCFPVARRRPVTGQPLTLSLQIQIRIAINVFLVTPELSDFPEWLMSLEKSELLTLSLRKAGCHYWISSALILTHRTSPTRVVVNCMFYHLFVYIVLQRIRLLTEFIYFDTYFK